MRHSTVLKQLFAISIVMMALATAMDNIAISGTVKWTGSGGDGKWTTTANWDSASTGPTPASDVVLDNTNVGGSYTVLVPINASPITVRTLQIGYSGSADTITLQYNSSQSTGGLKIGDGASGNADFLIEHGGVFINGATCTGATYFQKAATSDSVIVRSGGKYILVTSASFSTVFPAGTTKFYPGSTFETNYRAAGALLTLSGRTWGNWIAAPDSFIAEGGTGVLRDSGTTFGTPFVMANDMTVKSGVSVSISGGTGAPMRLYGNLTCNGSFQILSVNPFNFVGISAQSISGTGTIALKAGVYDSNATGVNLGLPGLTIAGFFNLAGPFTIGTGTLSLECPVAGTPANLSGGSTSSLVISGSTSGINLPASITELNSFALSNSNGTTLQGPLTVDSALILTSGPLAIGSNTLTMKGPISITGGSLSGGSTSSLVISGSKPGINIPAGITELNDFSINNINGTILQGPLTVDGLLTLANGTMTIGSNTLTIEGTIFTSGGSLTGGSTSSLAISGSNPGINIPAGIAELSNFTLNNANGTILQGSLILDGTLALTSGALAIGPNTLTVNGSISTTGGSLKGGSTSSLAISGSSPSINIPPGMSELNNFTLNNAHGMTLQGPLTVDGTLTLTSGAVTIASNTLTINGPISTTGGSLNGGSSSTIIVGGLGASTVLPAVTLNNFTLNRSHGISLGGALTVDGTLLLTQGNIVTGMNSVNIGIGGSVSHTNGWIVGYELKSFSTGAQTFTFDIGDENQYTPVGIQYHNITTPGSVTIHTVTGDHSLIGISGIDSTKSVNRYFSIAKNSLVFDYNLVRFNFAPGDVDPGTQLTSAYIRRYNGANWWGGPVNLSASSYVEGRDYMSTGDYIIGDPIQGGWTEQAGSPGTYFESVSIVDDRIAWACGDGGAVVRTTNGGTTWQAVTSLNVTDALNICGVSSTSALVCVNVRPTLNDGRIYRTTDGGATWHLVYQNTGTGAFMDAVNMFDPMNGVAVGDPVGGQWVLLKTTDGGATWTSYGSLSQTSNETGLNNSFKWIGTQSGWIGTDHPWIYRTTNGGTSWSAVPIHSSSPTFSLSFLNQSVGLAAGGPNVNFTTTGGAEWDSMTTFTGVDVRGACVKASSEKWWATQSNGLIKLSADGGASWSLAHLGPGNYTDIEMKNIPSTCFWVGYAVGGSGMISYYSEQYGMTAQLSMNTRWNLVSVPLSLGDYTKSTLFPTAISDAFGYNGSYSSQATLAQGAGYWMKFDSAQAVPIVGLPVQNDTVHVKAGWNLIGSISQAVPISSVTSDSAGVIAGGFFGYSVRYVESDTIYPGKGYWLKVNRDCDLIFSSTPISDRLRKRAITIVPGGELPPLPPGESSTATLEVPKEYGLGQNYPNPFNPTTTMSFAISHSSFVTLRVYDILGQEVATLVDGMEDGGRKSVVWDASNVPSGIYFYRLTARPTDEGQAGTFSDTKKLLLIK